MTILEHAPKTEYKGNNRGYRRYVRDGGLISKTVYIDAISNREDIRFHTASLSQANSMIRRIPQREARSYAMGQRSAIERIYVRLRERTQGECCGWPDEKIFAETLLIHHQFRGFKSFKNYLPNIFTRSHGKNV